MDHNLDNNEYGDLYFDYDDFDEDPDSLEDLQGLGKSLKLRSRSDKSPLDEDGFLRRKSNM